MDIVRYGIQYAGYIWADVTKLSLYGIGGRVSSPPTEVKITLSPGWNLISLPFILPFINGTEIFSADDLLQATGCIMASWWNRTSQQYVNYIAGFNLPTDPENFLIGNDDAVFLWRGEATGYELGPRNVHLTPGWNMIGYNRLATGNVTDWAAQVSYGAYDDICWWDGETFIHYIFPGTEMQLVPMRGYFVWSDMETWLAY